MESLEGALREYFSYLPVFVTDWVNKLKEIEKIFRGLQNQSEQLRLTRRSAWISNLLEKFPDVQTRLENKIICGIEEETEHLHNIWNSLSVLKKKLNYHLNMIERNSHKLSIACESSSGVILPPIYKLVEYAENAVRYYNALFMQMSFFLSTIDYEDEKSIKHVEDIFEKASLIDDNIKSYMLLWKVVHNT